ncbi:MAG: hypothetical protein F6K58_28240 [Symploca sp. SIO2E9]|nr:hypothetical protein [Symploca sp. SIO2E9]
MSKKKKLKKQANTIKGLAQLQAVVEVYSYDSEQLCPWSKTLSNSFGWIRLSEHTTELEIGSVLAQLVNYNHLENHGEAKEVLGRILSAHSLILPGGIQVRAASGKVINPGCCCGLEGWRDWLRFLKTGQSPWLGHGPNAWVERAGNLVRVWSDNRAKAFHIDFERSHFEAQLSKVQQDLSAFLPQVETWAAKVGFREPSKLSSKFDECFAVSRGLRRRVR